jgi:pimeloyl-ACP methyl ester carboxylesterase
MKPLLLLHGALASKSQFDALTPLLPDFDVHTLNFSGHGGNPIPLTGYSFDTFADDILRYIDSKKIDRIALFGYSMGGYAALYFAKKYPNRVERIFTLNTKFNWDPLTTAKETAMLNAEKMLEKVPNYANMLMIQHGMNIWKQVLKQTEDMMNNLTKHVVLIDEDYKQITCPVIIGACDKDTTATLAENLHIYQLLPNAGFFVLPNTAHPFEKVNLTILSTQIKLFVG